jgi:hypothetical protein
MNEYLPVPVEAARSVAETYRKGVVVVVALDQEHERMHFTSYGVSPAGKDEAARLADYLAAACGCGEDRWSFEDYRSTPAAEAARRVETLARAAGAADHLLASLQACRSGATDELIAEVREVLASALAEAGK